MHRLLALVSCLLIFSFLSVVPVVAKLEISEVYPNPLATADKSEWVELINAGDTSEDLADWEIDGTPISLSSVVLAPGEVWVVTKNLAEFVNEFLAITNVTELGALSLSNSGDSIVLSTQNTTSEFEYDTSSSQGSYQLKEGDCGEYEFYELSSPGVLNLVECDVEDILDPYLVSLQLTEYMVNPEGLDTNNEWIEIYNPTERNIELEGLEIHDSTGLLITFTEWDTIQSRQYLQINLSGQPLKNCNSMDCVETITLSAADKEVDKVAYSKSISGQSTSLLNGIWQLDLEVTPGAANREVKQPEVVDVPLHQQNENIREDQKLAVGPNNLALNPIEANFVIESHYFLPELVGDIEFPVSEIQEFRVPLLDLFVLGGIIALMLITIEFKITDLVFEFTVRKLTQLRDLYYKFSSWSTSIA